MKNEALKSGALEAPTSATGGTLSGRGVVSKRTVWLNLLGGGAGLVEVEIGKGCNGCGGGLPGRAGGHGGDLGGSD